MPLDFEPPVLNSANPWATTEDDLRALYDSPVGAVTTRTCLLEGFPHDDNIHQYTFFDTESCQSSPRSEGASKRPTQSLSNRADAKSSLNTLGYSPYPLSYYLSAISRIVSASEPSPKPFIISVTGTPEDVAQCCQLIAAAANPPLRLLVEINLSCPNIPSAPPPAYSRCRLRDYLYAVADVKAALGPSDEATDTRLGRLALEIGIKTPPLTYADQFGTIIGALRDSIDREQSLGRDTTCPINFITATNTLGNCLVLTDDESRQGAEPALASAAGTGIGGLAGEALHPLALGNVRTFRSMLDEVVELKEVAIIGVGGVSDGQGFRRMEAVGAEAVGVGTALGREGVGVFDKILQGI